jgi:large subunit ribosomal protein L14e
MFELGRFCVKIAGRDAGKRCLVIDALDDNHVMIDGETRRRKCNTKHLEPLDKMVVVTKNASHTEIIRVFKELGIELQETKPRKKAERPKRARKKKERAEEPAKKTSAKLAAKKLAVDGKSKPAQAVVAEEK